LVEAVTLRLLGRLGGGTLSLAHRREPRNALGPSHDHGRVPLLLGALAPITLLLNLRLLPKPLLLLLGQAPPRARSWLLAGTALAGRRVRCFSSFGIVCNLSG
jgi:hypothetical protein